MGIELLGPAQVTGAQGALGPRDRVILGALCVDPGQSLPPETLAEALWGEQPPKSWIKVVQGSVMRLRRALGDWGDPDHRRWISGVPGGGRAGHCRVRAAGRSGPGVPGAASAGTRREHVRASPGIVARPALLEFSEWEPARAEAARLLEVRHAVEEDLVAASLAAGRAVEAVAEAGPLVAREPFRERRWALLATALYRTGRQRDALDVLRRAGTTLREEFGLDPGTELVELERRMLRQDPSLLNVPASLGGTNATCPYRGLRAFDSQDADFYFGRSATVDGGPPADQRARAAPRGRSVRVGQVLVRARRAGPGTCSHRSRGNGP